MISSCFFFFASFRLFIVFTFSLHTHISLDMLFYIFVCVYIWPSFYLCVFFPVVIVDGCEKWETLLHADEISVVFACICVCVLGMQCSRFSAVSSSLSSPSRKCMSIRDMHTMKKSSSVFVIWWARRNLKRKEKASIERMANSILLGRTIQIVHNAAHSHFNSFVWDSNPHLWSPSKNAKSMMKAHEIVGGRKNASKSGRVRMQDGDWLLLSDGRAHAYFLLCRHQTCAFSILVCFAELPLDRFVAHLWLDWNEWSFVH